MKKTIAACLCTTVLLVFSHQLIARERDGITIDVNISPPQAQAVPVRTNWNMELRLYKETTKHEPGVNTTDFEIVSRDGKAANEYGKCVWNTLVFKPERPNSNTQIRYYYEVVCWGGWAYHDSYSQELDAGNPNTFQVNMYMTRK
jgi:hypothetical protein